MTRRPILLLVNPVAGGKPGSGPGLADDEALLAADALRDALKRRGLEVNYRELAEGDDLAELAVHAADTGHDVVVAGGDGTVSIAAAALVGHESATLGILAMGSFNNMARGFGIPVTLEEALDVIGAGAVTHVDAGWVVRGVTRVGRSSKRPGSASTRSDSWQSSWPNNEGGGAPSARSFEDCGCARRRCESRSTASPIGPAAPPSR